MADEGGHYARAWVRCNIAVVTCAQGPTQKDKAPSGALFSSCFVLHHALGRLVMVILQAGLVLAHLAIELVDQLVEGGVEILM